MGSCALGAWIAAVAVKDILRPAVASPITPLVRLALGSAPSLLSALALPLFFLAVHPRPGRREIGYACLWSVGLVTVAEAIERFLPGSTFDWRDWVAALAGVAVAAMIAWALVSRTVPAVTEGEAR